MEHFEYKGYQITKAYVASTPYFWIDKIFEPLQRTKYRLRVGDFDTLEEAKKAIDKGFE